MNRVGPGLAGEAGYVLGRTGNLTSAFAVGRAASGAMAERRTDSLADRLHGRTAQVRDRLAGVVPDASDLGYEGFEDDEPEEDAEPEEEETEEEAAAEAAGGRRGSRGGARGRGSGEEGRREGARQADARAEGGGAEGGGEGDGDRHDGGRRPRGPGPAAEGRR